MAKSPSRTSGPMSRNCSRRTAAKGKKKIGFPLTLHFGSGGGAARGRSFTCSMTTAKGEKIEGALMLDDGNARTATAPGMSTFYPLEPLPKGKSSTSSWSWMAGDKMLQAKGSFQSK
jgi:hypothetical protein